MSASYYISPCHASIQQSSHPNLVPVESMKMSMKSIKNALGFKGAKRLARENETYSTPAQFTRPDVPTDPPPAYHAQALLASASLSLADTTPVNALSDDRYEFLKSFDTIFLIDDSGSMAGSRWREVSHALECIAPICTRYDKDGIDIKFLNSREQRRHSNIIDATTVHEIFEAVRPGGGTPTGQRLNTILKEHLRQLESNPAKPPKPVNIIVITDGEPTDDVESPIINAARKLDKLDAEPWQIGVQFFQVGGDSFAKHHLEALDDNLSEIGGGCRDIVDTVPFLPGRVLEADFILKIVLGAVNKRLDRRHNPTR